MKPGVTGLSTFAERAEHVKAVMPLKTDSKAPMRSRATALSAQEQQGQFKGKGNKEWHGMVCWRCGGNHRATADLRRGIEACTVPCVCTICDATDHATKFHDKYVKAKQNAAARSKLRDDDKKIAAKAFVATETEEKKAYCLMAQTKVPVIMRPTHVTLTVVDDDNGEPVGEAEVMRHSTEVMRHSNSGSTTTVGATNGSTEINAKTIVPQEESKMPQYELLEEQWKAKCALKRDQKVEVMKSIRNEKRKVENAMILHPGVTKALERCEGHAIIKKKLRVHFADEVEQAEKAKAEKIKSLDERVLGLVFVKSMSDPTLNPWGLPDDMELTEPEEDDTDGDLSDAFGAFVLDEDLMDTIVVPELNEGAVD